MERWAKDNVGHHDGVRWSDIDDVLGWTSAWGSVARNTRFRGRVLWCCEDEKGAMANGDECDGDDGQGSTRHSTRENFDNDEILGGAKRTNLR